MADAPPSFARRFSSGSSFEAETGYARAVAIDGWVFVSGTTGFDYATGGIAPDPEVQCRQALANIEGVLAQAGCRLVDVVRARYLCPTRADFAACQTVLRAAFGAHPPAATMQLAGLLDPRMRIEIEVTARMPDHGGAADPLPALARLVEVMATLRGPDGCPWDREQSFQTIAPYTVEEAHEVADAIARGDMDALKDELGDLLLQVVFHARMAEEEKTFSLREVAEGIVAKLERRHPHVFGAQKALSADEVTANWEAIKAAEQPRASELDGIAPGLPALMRAQKIGRRAGRVGFDWADASGPRAKVLEEIAELDEAGTDDARREEAGDLLFAAVSWLRHLGIDAETALVEANAKFERRFREIEQAPGFASLSLEAKEQLWQDAKARLRAR
ncbi:MAG: nucleoside triphosphate pyrophosphohydrolase [Thermaurantiacus sp.]